LHNTTEVTFKMTEQELIDVINELIDADARAGAEMTNTGIARRAIDRCNGSFPLEAVADLVGQIFTHRFEPWMALPGAKPHLREWGEGVARRPSPA
jgi:hypothetical protein